MFVYKEVRTTTCQLWAVALWVAAVAVWGAGWFFDILHLTGLAVIIAAGAGTVTVRGFVLEHHEQMRTALLVTGRSEENVRRMER